jgi:hypothetical protein
MASAGNIVVLRNKERCVVLWHTRDSQIEEDGLTHRTNTSWNVLQIM